jgi:two-component system, LytTR family, sensor kinase
VHDDPAGAERMTGQLASLLRSSLDSSSTPLVRLDDELRVVRAYLDIERVRFGERLHYAVDVENHLASALVPRLGLQTLVENSVEYCVSPSRSGGSIRITAGATAEGVRLAVEDDGPGFDAALRPAGHGLDLLAGRLRLLFEHGASLSVDSRPGRTCVSIDVPRAIDPSVGAELAPPSGADQGRPLRTDEPVDQGRPLRTGEPADQGPRPHGGAQSQIPSPKSRP